MVNLKALFQVAPGCQSSVDSLSDSKHCQIQHHQLKWKDALPWKVYALAEQSYAGLVLRSSVL